MCGGAGVWRYTCVVVQGRPRGNWDDPDPGGQPLSSRQAAPLAITPGRAGRRQASRAGCAAGVVTCELPDALGPPLRPASGIEKQQCHGKAAARPGCPRGQWVQWRLAPPWLDCTPFADLHHRIGGADQQRRCNLIGRGGLVARRRGVCRCPRGLHLPRLYAGGDPDPGREPLSRGSRDICASRCSRTPTQARERYREAAMSRRSRSAPWLPELGAVQLWSGGNCTPGVQVCGDPGVWGCTHVQGGTGPIASTPRADRVQPKS